MERSTAILIALVAYFVGLLALGALARTKTHDSAGFYLGGRTLGPWVAALAANASSSSAWSLVGTSGFAYLHGLPALWLLPGCVGGFVLNWMVVAPRLRAATGDAVTLTDFLAGPPGTPWRRPIVWVSSLLTLASLLVYIAAQMQAAGAAFAHAFPLSAGLGVVLGAVVTIAYTLLGGYLAASITDTLQGLLMAGVAVVVPVAAVAHLGGFGELFAALEHTAGPDHLSVVGGREGFLAIGFAAGLCGIGLGYPGQPHAVNKFMGMAPGASMRIARTVGIGWAVLLYCGMIVLGWAARAAWQLPAGQNEDVLYVASGKLFPPLLDGIVLASILAAIMSTVDSQLLVCASCVTHDLRPSARGDKRMLAQARTTVLLIGAGATVAALFLPKNVFDNVLFAWAALGSAFGPLLIVRLCRGSVAPAWALGSIVAGGALAIAGSYADRWIDGLDRRFAAGVLSWGVSGLLAWVGSRRNHCN